MFCVLSLLLMTPTDGPPSVDLFAKENLVAWCIVPFDAAKRNPEERAEMLVDLGISKCAYDWRAEHVAEFEREIVAYQKHGIEFFAFWGQHDAAFALFQKYDLRPQIWQTAPSPPGETDAARITAAVETLTPLARQTQQLGCPLGLYNHGGWGGEPRNLVAVAEAFRDAGFDHVGIVYNLHHGHEHVSDLAEVLAAMKPYLLCLNLNGIAPGGDPKILPIGEGPNDAQILKTIEESGYEGPIGILDHRPEVDAEDALKANLSGLRRLSPSVAE